MWQNVRAGTFRCCAVRFVATEPTFTIDSVSRPIDLRGGTVCDAERHDSGLPRLRPIRGLGRLLMPRRQQRRPIRRRTKGDRNAGPEDTSALDASARRVLAANGGDPRRLEALVRNLQQLRDESDRVALEEPSPEALREYRRAVRELAEAERAFLMAGGV